MEEEEALEMAEDGTINFEGIELTKDEVPAIVEMIRTEMLAEANDLHFERAAELRDEIRSLEEFLKGKAESRSQKKKRKRRTVTPGQARQAKLKRRGTRSRKYRG